jgi:SAM-dependent methyltransferase
VPKRGLEPRPPRGHYRAMPSPYVDHLRCPYCLGRFETTGVLRRTIDPAYQVLHCHCGRYPVIAGIPVVKRGEIGYGGRTIDDAIELIEAGRFREALASALLPPPPLSPNLAPAWVRGLPAIKGLRRIQGKLHARRVGHWRAAAEELLIERATTLTACDLLDFYFRRSGHPSSPYDYFAFRFGQPRHLVALSLLHLVQQPSKPLLDLACGFGQITWSLLAHAQGQPVFGIDRSFFAVYVAKYWMAPQGHYVCCDADGSLPFPDDSLSAVICSDAIHYFAQKAMIFRELQRVVGHEGMIVMPSMRNSRVKQLHICQSLSPEGYAALLTGVPHRLLSDSSILDRYRLGCGPALARSDDRKVLDEAALLSLVASHREDVFRDHGPFDDWPHAYGRLNLNPLYHKTPGNGEVRLRLVFPSQHYEEENPECSSTFRRPSRSIAIPYEMSERGREPRRSIGCSSDASSLVFPTAFDEARH